MDMSKLLFSWFLEVLNNPPLIHNAKGWISISMPTQTVAAHITCNHLKWLKFILLKQTLKSSKS